MKNTKLFIGLLSASLCLNSVPVSAAGLTDFRLTSNKVTVNVGQSYDVDAEGVATEPSWISWDSNKVHVDDKGVVTGIRKGNSTVSARVGRHTQLCSVKVVSPTLKLNKKFATIYCGEGTSVDTVQLKATTKGASKDVVWSSSDVDVATVDTNGKVNAVSAGHATITVSANGLETSCDVYVEPNSIFLDYENIQLSTKGTGSSIKIKPYINGSKKSVKWSTSDKTIATVSNGKVTGKKSGVATITATANGVSATCNVTVIKDSISIGNENVTLFTGESSTLKTNARKGSEVVWSSSDSDVVTVDSTGKLESKKEGYATVTVSQNDTSDTCEVYVFDTVTDIDEETINLRTKGEDKTYTIVPEVFGRKNKVQWKSSNNKVVSVSSKGKLTAKKAGEADITLTANDLTDTVHVVVEDYIPTIKLNQDSYNLFTKGGNSLQLKVIVDGISKKVVWTSSNEEVATVNAKGKVTAVGEGSAIITAEANGVKASCDINVKETAVKLTSNSVSIDVGETADLGVDVIGKSQKVTYKVTNPKIAKIKNGVITAKAYGETDIKVTANGVSSVCAVKVVACEHVYDNGVITKDPTCTEEGIRTVTCTLCGNSSEFPVETIAHEYVKGEVVASTCLEQGYTKYVCACGAEELRDYTETAPHTFTDEVGKCSVCGTFVPGGYDAEGNLVVSWNDLIEDYNLNVSADFENRKGLTSPTSASYVLTNNADLSAIDTLVIDTSVKYIGKYNFEQLAKEINVVLPEGLETIAEGAFNECFGLKSVNLPESLESIGKGAFEYCSALKSVNLPNKEMELGIRVFYGCTALGEVNVPSRFKNVPLGMFGTCENLSDVTLEEGIVSIDIGAFSGCKQLTNVQLPSTLKSINGQAFSDCTALSLLEVPSGVKVIGSEAFLNVPSIVYNGSANGAPWGALAMNPVSVKQEAPLNAAVGNSPTEVVEDCSEGHALVDLTNGLCKACGEYVPGAYNEDGTLKYSWDVLQDEYEFGPSIVNGSAHMLVMRLGITNLVLPEIKSIPDWTFYRCTILDRVVLNQYTENVGRDAFKDCLNTTVYYPEDMLAGWSIYNWGAANSVAITESEVVVDLVEPQPSVSKPNNVYESVEVEDEHVWSDVQYLWYSNTGTIECQAIEECSHCDEVRYECKPAVIDVVEATCQENGSRTYTVDFDNERYETQTKTEVIPVDSNLHVDVTGDRICEECGALIAGCYDVNGNLLLSWQDLVDAGFDITNPTGDSSTTSLGIGKFYVKHTHDEIGEKLRNTDLIVVGEGVDYIGPNALNNYGIFWDSLYFTKVVLPDSVTRIDPTAFNVYYGHTIKSICYDGPAEGAPWGAGHPDLQIGPHDYVDGKCSKCGATGAPAMPEPIIPTPAWYNRERGTVMLNAANLCELGIEAYGDLIIPETVRYDNKACVVEAIAARTFESNDTITSVTIPDTVKHIGNDAFFACTSCRSITVPSSVESIDGLAFRGNHATVKFDCSLEKEGYPYGAWDYELVHNNCNCVDSNI